MLDKDLVDVAYDFMVSYLKKHGKDKTTLEFSEISKGVQKIINMSDGEFDKLLGSLYVDLLQDGRFVYLGSDKWTLKDLISLELYNKNQNSLYNYENGTPFVEVYDEDALPQEMVNEESEVYEENENEISRDSFDNEDSDEIEFNEEDDVVSEAEKNDDIVVEDEVEIEENDEK